jgi:glycosyltransferase involved in cell wall biosynthesis
MSRPDPDPLDLSIVVPVFNEEDNVAPFWTEIRSVLQGRVDRYEAIFVDDGSADRTVERLRRAAEGDPRVVIVRFTRNFGQTAALAAGFALARGRVVVPIDGDRQNDPAEIPRMLAMLGDEVDVVCGWRRDRHDAWLRRFVSRQANALIGRVTGVRLHDYGCTLKAFKAEYVKNMPLFGELHRFIPVLARAEGARIAEVVVNHRPRTAGQSKYGLDRTFRVLPDLLLVQFLTKYRGRAMRFFGRWAWIALGVAAVCFATAAIGWLTGRAATTFWLLVAMMAMGGMFASLGFGLLGELMWRIYYVSRSDRPWRIREIVRCSNVDNVHGGEKHTPDAEPRGLKPAALSAD